MTKFQQNVFTSIKKVRAPAAFICLAYFGYYHLKKPTEIITDALLIQRAKLLFDTKYSNDSPYKSIRNEDVNSIRFTLTRNKLTSDQEFNVVIGPTGIGKTKVVKTAADRLPGVITIQNVAAQDEIIARICSEINGTPT
jgi:hypothetical protein